MDIRDFDRNFQAEGITRTDIEWLELTDPRLRVHGLPEGWTFPLCRLPPSRLADMSEGVRGLAYHTAGARVRFRTDSQYLAFKGVLLNINDMNHMPRSGSAGVDVYLGRPPVFRKAIMPELAVSESLAGEWTWSETGMQEILLHVPLYNGLRYAAIGVAPGAQVELPTPYAIEKPLVFYGSSITQGGCASRPGNAYPAFLSRWLDADFINLGFSGNAKGEPAMARYIAGLEMSLLVMDYDHNADDVAFLRSTHRPFYEIVRDAQPELPILFVSKPDVIQDAKTYRCRREVILETLAYAQGRGDRRVAFVDGERLFAGVEPDACTVDGTHPNDLGFYRMARVMEPTIRALLGSAEQN